jgi:replicative DNA helicase
LIDQAAIRLDRGNSFVSVNNFLIGSIISLSERSRVKSGFIDIKDASKKLFERMEAISKGEVKKIYTGLRDLDKHLGGIEEPDVIIIAARPSMGKTSLATRFLSHISKSDKEKDNLIFSLETSDMRIAEKLHCQNTRIQQYKFNNCGLDQGDWDRLSKSMDDYSGINNILISDRVNISEKDVLAECIKHSYKKPVGSFFLDYLQLLKSPPGAWSREREVSEQSRIMKVIAKELNCPAFILSQLNRALESRSDKEPTLSDLRDSGSLEQDADIILFIYRDEVYNKDSEWRGKAKIIIAKNKRGKTGFVVVGWNGETTSFYDL